MQINNSITKPFFFGNDIRFHIDSYDVTYQDRRERESGTQRCVLISGVYVGDEYTALKDREDLQKEFERQGFDVVMISPVKNTGLKAPLSSLYETAEARQREREIQDALESYPETESRKVLSDGIEIETRIKTINGICAMEVEAGTTGYRCGDRRTYFRFEDLADTDIRPNIFSNSGNGGIEVTLGGDAELDTIIQALRFAADTLARQKAERR